MAKNRIRYPSHKPFLRVARSHQRLWLRIHFGIESTDQKRVLLPEDEAYAGLNFFSNHVCELVKRRYRKAFQPNGKDRPRTLVSDALRSEHIPFNLFAPLSKYPCSDNLAAFFSVLCGTELTSIDQIHFEYADPTARSMLDDNTAFDAYVIAQQSNRPYAICIEVKYTEGPYSWGATEKRRMFDPSDAYIRLSETSAEIRPLSFKNLHNRHLKQIWRNYLLGVATAQRKTCDFVYIHLYPEGNLYQAAVCSHFAHHLTKKGLCAFRPTTYENFLRAAVDQLHGDLLPWIKYIEKRYIVPPS